MKRICVCATPERGVYDVCRLCGGEIIKRVQSKIAQAFNYPDSMSDDSVFVGEEIF